MIRFIAAAFYLKDNLCWNMGEARNFTLTFSCSFFAALCPLPSAPWPLTPNPSRFLFIISNLGCPLGKQKRIVEKSSKREYNIIMNIKEEMLDKRNTTYSTLTSDTSPQIQEILISGYRRMSPQQKLKRVNELTKAVQQLALARIRQQYGTVSEREQRLRLASLWLDRKTMVRVFNWDPFVEGY